MRTTSTGWACWRLFFLVWIQSPRGCAPANNGCRKLDYGSALLSNMTRRLAVCLLVAAAAIVGTTNAYGEGMFSTRNSCATNRTNHAGSQGGGPATRVSFSEPDLDCSHIHASSAPISRVIGVRVASPPRTDKLCVQLRARSSSELAWWYMMPPPATRDSTWDQCVATEHDRDVSLEFNISLPVTFLDNIVAFSYL